MQYYQNRFPLIDLYVSRKKTHFLEFTMVARCYDARDRNHGHMWYQCSSGIEIYSEFPLNTPVPPTWV